MFNYITYVNLIKIHKQCKKDHIVIDCQLLYTYTQ